MNAYYLITSLVWLCWGHCHVRICAFIFFISCHISALSCNILVFGIDWLYYGHVNLTFELLQILALLLLLPQAKFWLFFYQLDCAETFSFIWPCCIVAVLCCYFFRYGWLNSTKLSISLCLQTAYLTKTCFCILKQEHPWHCAHRVIWTIDFSVAGKLINNVGIYKRILFTYLHINLHGPKNNLNLCCHHSIFFQIITFI